MKRTSRHTLDLLRLLPAPSSPVCPPIKPPPPLIVPIRPPLQPPPFLLHLPQPLLQQTQYSRINRPSYPTSTRSDQIRLFLLRPFLQFFNCHPFEDAFDAGFATPTAGVDRETVAAGFGFPAARTRKRDQVEKKAAEKGRKRKTNRQY
jgi:hypothetical protein